MTKFGENVFTFYSEPFTWKEINTKSEQKFFIEGYISTPDRDLVGDIVTQNCLDSMIEQMRTKTLKLDFEHESWMGDTAEEKEKAKSKSPLGKAVNAHKDGTGLFLRWEVNKDYKKFDSGGNIVKTFSEIRNEVKNGYLDAFSIAYIPTKTNVTTVNGLETRLLDNINLLNVALTGNPVNTQAKMVNVFAKSLEFMKSCSSNDDKNRRITMTEETTEKKPEETTETKISEQLKSIETRLKALEEPEPEAPKETTEETAEPEEKPEPPAEPVEEPKEDTLAEVKSEVVEIKKLLMKSQPKALQENMKSEITKKNVTILPLDIL